MVAYKVPPVEGTFVQFQNLDLQALQNNGLTGKMTPDETQLIRDTFMVMDYNGLLKLSQFTNILDYNGYKQFTPQTIHVANASYFDVTDFSGTVPPFQEYLGHSLNPACDKGNFRFSVPSYYHQTSKYKDPHIKNGKTDIYPEGTFIKCHVGGKNTRTTTNRVNVTNPTTIYRVDKYGNLNDLPDNPSDLAINHSWNTATSTWLNPEVCLDCTGVSIHPTLSFNPALLPPDCTSKSCMQNEAALKLLDYLPINMSKTEDHYFQDMTNGYANDLSKNLHKFNYMVQSSLINKIANNKPSFDPEFMKSLHPLFTGGSDDKSFNIRNDYEILEENKGTTRINADTAFVLPLKHKLMQFELSSCMPLQAGNTNIWPYGQTYGAVPMGNQIQFGNNKEYCLEDSNGTVVMKRCDATNANQYWDYDYIDWNLRNKGTEQCLVADAGFRSSETNNNCGGAGGEAGILLAGAAYGPIGLAVAGAIVGTQCHDTTSYQFHNDIPLKTKACNPNEPLYDVYMDEQGNIKMAPQKLNGAYGFDTFLQTQNDTFSDGQTIYMNQNKGQTSTFYVPGSNDNPVPNCQDT